MNKMNNKHILSLVHLTKDGKNFYSTLNDAYEGLSENTFIKKLSEILFLDKTKKTIE